MSYTQHTLAGTVTRDADGVVVSPVHDDQDPAHLEWLAWCAEGNTPEVDDAPPLDMALADKLAAINAHAWGLRDAALAGVHPGEAASWSSKLAEALRYPDAAPMLEAEAAARGVPLHALVAKVRSNADALSAREAQIAGIAGRHRDAVRALATGDAVMAYDHMTGWPD